MSRWKFALAAALAVQVALALGRAAEPEGGAAAEEKTANFVVRAPSSEAARAVAAEAERRRRSLSQWWLGTEPPAWQRPCEIRITLVPGPSGGQTSFAFAPDRPVVTMAGMSLQGDLRQLLASVLPHELAHVVLMNHFGRPIPRWADEGAAILAEAPVDQAVHDARCRDVMSEGRGIRLRVLFRMTDYPRDLMALYTEGHSVVRFLAGPGPCACGVVEGLAGRVMAARFLRFLAIGTDGNSAESWDKAAKDLYGYESVDALEEAWLDWLKSPASVLTRTAADRSVAPLARDVGGDMIPPLRVPGSGQPPVPPPGAWPR
jgi:hypothetical protein